MPLRSAGFCLVSVSGEAVLGTSLFVNASTLLLLTLWAAAFFGAFVVFLPADVGQGALIQQISAWLPGFNRIGAFLTLHGIALLFGLAVRRYARKREWRLSPRLYRISSVPVLLAIGEVTGFSVLVLAVWAFD